MNEATIKRAVAEAKRFLAAADVVLKTRIKEYPGSMQMPKATYLETGRDTGALRRASLDLTRSLADMRKSG